MKLLPILIAIGTLFLGILIAVTFIKKPVAPVPQEQADNTPSKADRQEELRKELLAPENRGK